MKKYFLTNSGNEYKIKPKEVLGVDSGLRNKSLFNPPQQANHQVEVFKQLVLRDLEDLPVKKSLNPKYIREVIKALEARKDVIICPADKGGGVVIMHKSYYHTQLQTMLDDEITYRHLPSDPTKGYRNDHHNLVDFGYYMRVITKK